MTMYVGGYYISKSVYSTLSLKYIKLHINHIVTLLHLLPIYLNLYNQRKQRLSLIIATVCYVHWGVKTVLKCTICQNKTRASNKGLIHMDKQRVGGGDKMAKTEPPGRASVATEPKSLFYFYGPAKLAVEAPELQGQLNIILWMSVWGSTVLEYPFDICWVFSVSKPGVILCGIAGRQTKIMDAPRLGSVVIWFCA